MTLAIKNGRHPIHEEFSRSPFVPNDAYSTNQSRLQILTGCNMAGKSTYLRQIALIVILAQIGCFVPADYASMPIFEELFTRFATDGGPDLAASSFSAEMREMAFILREATKKSFCIVDELGTTSLALLRNHTYPYPGRGTSTQDGLAISVAVCERLLATGSVVLFSTHFAELQRLFTAKLGVTCLHLEVNHDEGRNALVMQYKIAGGLNEELRYGLKLAAATALPVTLIQRAETASRQLKKHLADQEKNSRLGRVLARRKALSDLQETLKQISQHDSSLETPALRSWLNHLLIGVLKAS